MALVIAVEKPEIISHLANNPTVYAFKFTRGTDFLITYKIGDLAFESKLLSSQDVSDLETTFGVRVVDLSVVGYQAQELNLNELATIVTQALVDGAPGALDTLNELSQALGNDANFASTITNNITTLQGQVTANSNSISQVSSNQSSAIESYLDRHHAQSLNPDTHNSTANLKERFNIDFNLAHNTEYLATLTYNWAYDAGTTDFASQFLVGGQLAGEHKQEPQDSGGGSYQGSGTDQIHTATMRYIFTPTPGDVNFIFRFGPTSNGVTATVYRYTLTVERFR